jgi:hypothetical protein
MIIIENYRLETQGGHIFCTEPRGEQLPGVR